MCKYLCIILALQVFDSVINLLIAEPELFGFFFHYPIINVFQKEIIFSVEKLRQATHNPASWTYDLKKILRTYDGEKITS